MLLLAKVEFYRCTFFLPFFGKRYFSRLFPGLQKTRKTLKNAAKIFRGRSSRLVPLFCNLLFPDGHTYVGIGPNPIRKDGICKNTVVYTVSQMLCKTMLYFPPGTICRSRFALYIFQSEKAHVRAKGIPGPEIARKWEEWRRGIFSLCLHPRLLPRAPRRSKNRKRVFADLLAGSTGWKNNCVL